LPVVWAVAKGSALNKAILVPAALAISQFLPWLVNPLLMLGGAYLCFEGAEKLAHKFFHADEESADRKVHELAVADESVDLVAFEKEKIKGAIRTDFILSAEIIVIALGTVADKPFATKVAVMGAIAALMTVGVYGLVAGIVKLDDLGLYLSQRASSVAQAVGRGIVAFAPWLMKALSVAGTAAMFLVGGSIVLHGIAPLYRAVQQALASQSGWAQTLGSMGADAVVGLVVGAVLVLLVSLFRRLKGPSKVPSGH
jgi:uncharacterized protein